MSGRSERLFADGLPVRLADIRAIGDGEKAGSGRSGNGRSSSGGKGRKKSKNKRPPGGGRPQPDRADNISNHPDRPPTDPGKNPEHETGRKPKTASCSPTAAAAAK